MSQPHYHPLWELILCRIRVFYRQPEAVFWTYGFPLVMITALGLAFREESKETILVDVVGPQAEAFEARLSKDSRYKVKRPAANDWKKRLQTGKTNLVVETGEAASEKPRFWFEPHRAESVLAREAVENAILRSALPNEASDFAESHLEEVGSRYIDFLLPGMIGMNLMGGGMWGIGFVVVDMRVRKLLKRLQATPMRRSDFLFSLMLVRLLFAVFDMGFLTVFGHYAFGVECRGSLLDLALVMLVGGASFAGIGLLIACRAQTTETISGLMNLVMLPMWLLSGLFFSSARFPAAVQPLIKALPLTALLDSLRAVMQEGATLASQLPQVGLLAGWSVVTFFLALRWFRWI